MVTGYTDVQEESEEKRKEAAVGTVAQESQGRAREELDPGQKSEPYTKRTEEQPQLEAPCANRKHSWEAIHRRLLGIDGFSVRA